MTILGTAQTYIGVLATFLVLCIFNNKSNNFLLSIIIELGNDTLKVLHEYALKLKSEIHSVYENKEDKTSNRVGELVDKAYRQNPELAKKLLNNRNRARFLENNFFKEAMETRGLFAPETVENKPELTYIAFLTLVLIMLIMLVDLVDLFSIEIRSFYVNILIGIGLLYSILLYRNFFKNNQHELQNNGERFEKPSRYWMIISIFLSFLLWLIACLFFNRPYISCLLFPVVMTAGLFLTKRKWILICDKYQRYDKTFVLKHSVYMILFASLCTFIVYVLTSFSFIYDYAIKLGCSDQFDDWNNAISMMQNANITRYVIVIFFTSNTFVFPLFVGLSYLKKKEKLVIVRMDSVYHKYKKQVQGYEESFKIIEREIEEDEMT